MRANLRNVDALGSLDRLERLVRLREPQPPPRGPSRGMMIVFLLMFCAATVFCLLLAMSGEPRLFDWMFVLLSLMWSVWTLGEILYPLTSGRMLRVFARLVLMPAVLAMFLISWYADFGSTGGLLAAAFLICASGLTWLVARYSGPLRERRLR